jgi:hypothetical protein
MHIIWRVIIITESNINVNTQVHRSNVRAAHMDYAGQKNDDCIDDKYAEDIHSRYYHK